jgi:hypothetical protein
MKKCPNCEISKPFNEFYKSAGRHDGLQSWCKICHDNRRIKNLQKLGAKEKAKNSTNKSRRFKNFGITEAQYNQMFTSQEGRCLGCLRHQSELNKSLAVDHCHTTGKIRGLLCDNCNRGLGFLKDNKDTLKRLGEYLDNARNVDHVLWEIPRKS